jgi:hypothetical protein
MFWSQLAPVPSYKVTGAPERGVNSGSEGVLGGLPGVYALELGTGVVRHAQNMFG